MLHSEERRCAMGCVNKPSPVVLSQMMVRCGKLDPTRGHSYLQLMLHGHGNVTSDYCFDLDRHGGGCYELS